MTERESSFIKREMNSSTSVEVLNPSYHIR